MRKLTNIPTPRASVIVPADSPLLTFTDSGAIYRGPCPAASHGRGHRIRIAHNTAKCGICGTEFTARIIRPLLAERYLQLEF